MFPILRAQIAPDSGAAVNCEPAVPGQNTVAGADAVIIEGVDTRPNLDLPQVAEKPHVLEIRPGQPEKHTERGAMCNNILHGRVLQLPA